MRHWLIKSEPDCYSIDDLKRDGKTHWDGVRNYQARNFMRDDMRMGDKVLFYHSSTEPPHIAGFARVASEPYPDPTQFDTRSEYYDPTSTHENPRWMLVDIAYVGTCRTPLSLASIKKEKRLHDMPLTRRGQRLSIQPVSKKHFEYIEKMCS